MTLKLPWYTKKNSFVPSPFFLLPLFLHIMLSQCFPSSLAILHCSSGSTVKILVVVIVFFAYVQ